MVELPPDERVAMVRIHLRLPLEMEGEMIGYRLPLFGILSPEGVICHQSLSRDSERAKILFCAFKKQGCEWDYYQGRGFKVIEVAVQPAYRDADLREKVTVGAET